MRTFPRYVLSRFWERGYLVSLIGKRKQLAILRSDLLGTCEPLAKQVTQGHPEFSQGSLVAGSCFGIYATSWRSQFDFSSLCDVLSIYSVRKFSSVSCSARDTQVSLGPLHDVLAKALKSRPISRGACAHRPGGKRP